MSKNLQPYKPTGVISMVNHRNSNTQIYDYRIHKDYERFSIVWFAITGQDMIGTTVFYQSKVKNNLISDMERVEVSYSRMGVLLSKFAEKHHAIPAVGPSGELYYHHRIIEGFIKSLRKGRIKIKQGE